MDIFYSANQGYSSGIRFDADSIKTAFLPWMMSMMLDSVYVDGQWAGTPSLQAFQLMTNILRWFEIDNAVARKNLCEADKFSLSANYPNPFNSETIFQVILPRKCHITVEIYNILGQKIKTVLDDEMPAGNYIEKWDGKNEQKKMASAGIYLIRMKAGDYEESIKATRLP